MLKCSSKSTKSRTRDLSSEGSLDKQVASRGWTRDDSVEIHGLDEH